MIIKYSKSIEDYKRIRDEKINAWIDARFDKGCVTWILINPFEILLTDLQGDTMIVSLNEID